MLSGRLQAEKMQSFFLHAGTSKLEFSLLLTDPEPESATESLPESGVRVWLVFTALPSTGQSLLAVIWLVLVSVCVEPASFWLVSMTDGVTVILGTGLSYCPTLLGEEGLDLDFGDSRATRPAPEEGLWGDLEEESWSGPENLLIRSLMLPVRRRLEPQDRPFKSRLFEPALQACSASSLLVVWWELSDDWEEVTCGAGWKRWTQ